MMLYESNEYFDFHFRQKINLVLYVFYPYNNHCSLTLLIRLNILRCIRIISMLIDRSRNKHKWWFLTLAWSRRISSRWLSNKPCSKAMGGKMWNFSDSVTPYIKSNLRKYLQVDVLEKFRTNTPETYSKRAAFYHKRLLYDARLCGEKD